MKQQLLDPLNTSGACAARSCDWPSWGYVCTLLCTQKWEG